MEHIFIVARFRFVAVATNVCARNRHAEIPLRTPAEFTSKPFFLFCQQMPVGMTREIMCGPRNSVRTIRFENLTKNFTLFNELLLYASLEPSQQNNFIIKIFLCHYRSAD